MQGCSHDYIRLLWRLGSCHTDLLLKALSEACHQGGTTRQHDVAVKVSAQVLVTHLDTAVRDGGESIFVQARQRGVKDDFRGRDALMQVDLYDLAAGQLVAALLLRETILPGAVLLAVVLGHMAHSLFHLAHLLEVLLLDGHFGGHELINQFLSDVLPRHIQLKDSVGQCVALENGDCVGGALARFSDEARSGARGEEGEGGRVNESKALDLEVFEHHLANFLLVLLRVHGAVGH